MNSALLTILGSRITEEYLQKQGTLNSLVAKYAASNGLTHHQIARLSETVNHAVNAEIHKSASDKTFVFDLADAEQVNKLLNKTASPAIDILKVAECFATAAAKVDAELIKKAEAMNVPSAEEIAAYKRGVKITLNKVAARVEQRGRQAEAEYFGALDAFAKSFDKLADTATQLVRRKEATINEIFKIAQAVEPEKAHQWHVLISKVAERLKKTAHPFSGDYANSMDLSEQPDTHARHGCVVIGPKVVVINGASSIVATIKDVGEHVSKAEMAASWKTAVDNFRNVIRTSETQLFDNDSVRDYIDTGFQKMADYFDAKTATREQLDSVLIALEPKLAAKRQNHYSANAEDNQKLLQMANVRTGGSNYKLSDSPPLIPSVRQMKDTIRSEIARPYVPGARKTRASAPGHGLTASSKSSRIQL